MFSSPFRNARWQRRLAIAFQISILVLLYPGCDSAPAAPPRGQPPLVSCPERPVRMAVAASLREIAMGLVEDLGRRTPALSVETSFGASSALARQLELGAPIDLLISADEELIRSLADKGVIAPDSVHEIATGRLVLAARAESRFAALGIEALRSSDLKRLGLPARAVPLGRYGRAWLERSALLAGLRGKIVTTENARANLTAVHQGHVDLALLYESDLRLRPSLRVVFRPEPETYPPIRYVAARAQRAPGCLEIDRVLDAWRQRDSRNRLARAGFGLPPIPSVRAPTRSVGTKAQTLLESGTS